MRIRSTNFSTTCCTDYGSEQALFKCVNDKRKCKNKRINIFSLSGIILLRFINTIFFLKGILLKNRKSLLWLCTVSWVFFFIIILGTLIFKTHNHFPIFKNMKIKSTKFMIIIITYLSQAYDWSIDQMIMLKICHKSCYTTNGKKL